MGGVHESILPPHHLRCRESGRLPPLCFSGLSIQPLLVALCVWCIRGGAFRAVAVLLPTQEQGRTRRRETHVVKRGNYIHESIPGGTVGDNAAQCRPFREPLGDVHGGDKRLAAPSPPIQPQYVVVDDL